ncbi:MAG: magnesium chelatase, partial [Bacteroidia bacterium]|nr:magnesium chelatase [Bacteroidia bacterium]
FNDGNQLYITNTTSDVEYEKMLLEISGLQEFVEQNIGKQTKHNQLFMMEFVLHGLAEFSQISKTNDVAGPVFKDIMSGMFNAGNDSESSGDYGGFYESR